MLVRLFEGPLDPRLVLVALVPTLVVAWLLSRLARRLAAAALRAVVHDTLAPTSPLVRGPLRLVSAAVFILVVGVALFPAFEVAGLRPRTGVRATRDGPPCPGRASHRDLTVMYQTDRFRRIRISHAWIRPESPRS